MAPAIGPSKRIYRAVCRPGRLSEDYAIELPEGLSLMAMPQEAKIDLPSFSYRRWWTRMGRTLRRKTEIVSSVKSRTCAPDYINALSKAFDEAKEIVYPTQN